MTRRNLLAVLAVAAVVAAVFAAVALARRHRSPAKRDDRPPIALAVSAVPPERATTRKVMPSVEAPSGACHSKPLRPAEAVVVATSAGSHAALARTLIERRLPTLVEKPFTLSVADAEQVASQAEAHGVPVVVGHLLLFHPAVERLRAMLAGGELGQLYYLYSHRVNLGQVRPDENALWSLAPHDISVILHLLGLDPTDVTARGQSYLQPGIEDVVLVTLNFNQRSMAHIHVSWLDPHKIRKLTLVGSQRMVVFDDMELERKVTIYEKAPEEPAGTYGEWRTRTGDIFSPKIPNDEPLRLECQAFLDLVAGRGDARRTALDGLAVVRTLEQLQSSLAAVPA